MPYVSRPAKAVINLDALRHNYRLAQSMTPDGQVIAVIKADAYGHGAVPIAKALCTLAPAFAVACIEEALLLREAKITQPILLLEGPFNRQDLQLAAQYQFWVMLESARQIEWLLEATLDKPLSVWLKVDTGMHRLGLTPQQAELYMPKLKGSDNVAEDIVLTTHFACADDLHNPFTQSQIDTFEQLHKKLPGPASMANSAGILGWPSSIKQWSRAGIMLYGTSPFSGTHPVAEQLQPVMTLQTEVMSLRQVKQGDTVGYGNRWQAQNNALIATIAMGYADGYPRSAPCGTPVLVKGQQAEIAGQVSMDMIGIDVTHIDSVKVGDPVQLWGKDLSLNHIAQKAGSINYQLLAGMPARVPRVYL